MSRVTKAIFPKDELDYVEYCNDIINWAGDIESEWNGDESGRQEDRAHCAKEIIEKTAELYNLIAEMSEL